MNNHRSPGSEKKRDEKTTNEKDFQPLSARAGKSEGTFFDLFFHSQYGTLSGLQLCYITFYDMVPINHIP